MKQWFNLELKNLDEVIDLDDEHKIIGTVRAAYQCSISVSYKDGDKPLEVIPYTFEDALVLSNINLFRKLNNSTGMVKKMHLAFDKPSLNECCEELFKELKGSKAQMALDLLFDVEPKDLCIPKYIEEGFEWLKQELNEASSDFIDNVGKAVVVAKAID